jgi:hypothetical protein
MNVPRETKKVNVYQLAAFELATGTCFQVDAVPEDIQRAIAVADNCGVFGVGGTVGEWAIAYLNWRMDLMRQLILKAADGLEVEAFQHALHRT